VTAFAGGAVIVTVPDADLVGWAIDVAVTVTTFVGGGGCVAGAE
jgi:hypothetical protein